MVGRIAPLDVVELLLLVDVDQNVAGNRVEKPGAVDLARLKHDVAVRQNHRGAQAARVLDHVQRVGEEPVRERVVDEERGHREQVRVARVLDAVALQRAEIVGIAEFGAQVLEERPVAVLPLAPHLPGQVAPCRSAATRSLSSRVLSTS